MSSSDSEAFREYQRECWEPPVPDDGAALLDDLREFIARFVAYPSQHVLVAHVLWIIHTHLMDVWDSTPRIAFLSPEPGSGKTRALEVTELFVPAPVEAINVTPAYLFRKVGADAGRPTILYDEIDTVFGPKAKDNEEIRGLLNAGHRRGAVAGRCVVKGKIVETEEIPAYCAVALAGIGGLPDTLLSRSVVVRMRRRAPGERIEPFRRREQVTVGHELRDRIGAWAQSIAESIDGAWPAMPAGVEDRDADIWEALLVVADAAGGHWPARARAAAVALVAESKQSTPSLGIRLLADLRAVFGGADVMFGETILEQLHAMDEAPWLELVHGKPLNARGLARRLADYGVRSQTVRMGDRTAKGYRAADLVDAWSRYLPPIGPPTYGAVTSVTPSQPPAECDGVTDVTDSMGGEPTGPDQLRADAATVLERLGSPSSITAIDLSAGLRGLHHARYDGLEPDVLVSHLDAAGIPSTHLAGQGLARGYLAMVIYAEDADPGVATASPSCDGCGQTVWASESLASGQCERCRLTESRSA